MLDKNGNQNKNTGIRQKQAHITYEAKTARVTFCAIGTFIAIETFVAIET